MAAKTVNLAKAASALRSRRGRRSSETGRPYGRGVEAGGGGQTPNSRTFQMGNILITKISLRQSLPELRYMCFVDVFRQLS